MSKNKEIINKLFNIVAKQQQVLTKIAQTVGGAAGSELRAPVQADIYDLLYGKSAQVPPAGTRVEIHYAKYEESGSGKTLVVGVTVPDQLQRKWDSVRGNVELALKNKYRVSAVVFKQ